MKESKDHVVIYSPNRDKKMLIRKPRSKIKSSHQKRVELQHLEDMIAAMSGNPDFGFETDLMARDESKKGWSLMIDFVLSNSLKYERLTNAIYTRLGVK